MTRVLNLARRAAVCGAFVLPLAAQTYNRLELHNGGDVLPFLNAPFAGSPVGSGDFTGDAYWKVFPGDALQRCDGTASLVGLAHVIFDTDFSTECLWDYYVTTSMSVTSLGTIVPGFTSGVFVPGLSTTATIFGSPGSAPGYLAGWIYDELFLDSSGQPASLLEMTADGTEDWVFTHLYPAPGIANHDPSAANPDVTYQWSASIDESQPDVLGNQVNQYFGINIGGAGVFQPTAQPFRTGAETEFYFEGPTVSVGVSSAYFTPGPSRGFEALETPLQIKSFGPPAPDKTLIAGRVYDEAASTSGLDVALWTVAVGPESLGGAQTFLDLGLGCVPVAGGEFAMPLLGGVTAVFGLNPYTDDGSPIGGVFNNANLAPAGVGPAWPNVEIAWQAFRVSLVQQALVSSSQVFKQTMRYADGL